MSGLILVVEDETDLAMSLEYNLSQQGFRIKVVANGQDALQAMQGAPIPDLVLLDLMLPDISGTEVCRQIRAMPQAGNVPIIMLTAKSDEIDRVVGFEVGADDYVTKPYSVRELLLRVRALLRRSSWQPGSQDELTVGAFRVDRAAHRAWVHDEEVRLTPLEFRLLVVLMERQGRVQSRDRLLADVWGIQSDVNTRTVDTHVKRLREKLGDAGLSIQTLRGVGYRLGLGGGKDDQEHD